MTTGGTTGRATTESGSGQLGPGRAVWLVARREITTRMRSKAFLITTSVMLVGVIGAVIVLALVSGRDTATRVAFAPQSQPVSAAFATLAGSLGQQVEVSEVADAAAGELAVREERLDVLVTGAPANLTAVVRENLSPQLENVFAALARQIALDAQVSALGGDPVAVNRAVATATVPVRALEPPPDIDVTRLVLGIVSGILVYIALLIAGSSVAQGVVEEKVSRIVELLLTTIRPWQLMLGKVFGIGLVGLVQVVVIGVGGVGAGLIAGVIDLPASIAVGAVLWTLVWFLLGYLMYALLFAASAALVSRQEDVGGVVTPVTMLLILPYVLSISILPSDPDNSLLAGLSLFPLFSPMIMPMRQGIGVPVWQVAVAISLSVLLIAFLVWLAGRIYGNAVLRSGARVKLRDALRAG